MDNIIKVGMADLNVAISPNILTTLGLGSCIGVCLYDSTAKVAGMAHIMLPYSTPNRSDLNPAKYADTGIALLLDNMIKTGAQKSHITAKLAGGAQMFKLKQENDIIKIGLKNAEACKEILGQLNIQIVAEETGGNYGRTIEFSAADGKLFIKTIGFGIKYI
jgi:chemotaxis protein CheD